MMVNLRNTVAATLFCWLFFLVNEISDLHWFGIERDSQAVGATVIFTALIWAGAYAYGVRPVAPQFMRQKWVRVTLLIVVALVAALFTKVMIREILR